MKKSISLLLAVLIACTIGAANTAASVNQNKTNITEGLHIAKSRQNTPEADLLARTYFKSMKEQMAIEPSMFGFTAEELAGASLGGAFTVYVFDKNGETVSDDGLAYPVFYDGEIAAVLEIGYGSDSKYHCTFGKAYAKELNDIFLTGNLNAAKGMIIGRIADKFFLTDGEHVEIILDKPAQSQSEVISKEELEPVCSKLPLAIDASYVAVDKPAKAVYGTAAAQKKTIRVGKSFTLKLKPANGFAWGSIAGDWKKFCDSVVESVSFSSSNSKVAAVGKLTGKVKGKKAGSAVIRTVVKFKDGGKEIYTTKVIVKH